MSKVIVCEACNEPATDESRFVLDVGGQETMICECGSKDFTIIEMEPEWIPVGTLVIEPHSQEN